MEFPYIDKANIGYLLYFEIPEELANVRIPDIIQPNINNLAKKVFESFQIPAGSYPRLGWKDGSLERIALGEGCACVTRSDRRYQFHNVDGALDAMAALQILSRYVITLSVLSSQPNR